MTDKPNHNYANSPHEEARNAQGCLRRLEHRLDGVSPGAGKGGQDKPLDDEDQTHGRQKVAHPGGTVSAPERRLAAPAR